MENLSIENVEASVKKTIEDIDIRKLKISDWNLIDVNPDLKTINVEIKGVQFKIDCEKKTKIVRKRKLWFNKVEFYDQYEFSVNGKFGLISEEFANYLYNELCTINKVVNRNIVLRDLGGLLN